MRDRIAALVGTFSVLIIITIIVMAYWMLHHPDKMAAINKIAEKAPSMHKVVVLDFDDNGLLDEAELMQGRDAVIVVNNPKMGVNESFNSVSAFQKLDVNKDGVINDKDPLYRYMDLMFFDKDSTKRRYISFAQAGIKSIKIDQKRLTTKQTASLDPKDNIIGEATFINGRQHNIRLIMVSVPHD